MIPSAAICRTSARTSRVPCGSRPLVGSSRMIRSRGASSAGRDRQALLHAEGVVAVPLPRGGGQADALQGLADPRLRRRGGRGPVGRVVAGQVVPAGQVRVERRALDQRADPGQHARPRRPASGRRAARRTRWSGRPGRAACGSSWSCPSRSGRGSRRPRPAGTARSTWSTASWPPRNRLVSPELAIASSAVASSGQLAGSSGRVPHRRVQDARLDRADVDLAVGHQHRDQAGAAPACRCPSVPCTGLAEPSSALSSSCEETPSPPGRSPSRCPAACRGRRSRPHPVPSACMKVLLRERHHGEPARAVGAEAARVRLPAPRPAWPAARRRG